MQLYTDKCAQIDFRAEHSQLYLKWISEPSENDLIYTYTKALDFAKTTYARSLVVDNSIGFIITLSMQRSLASLAVSMLHQVQIRKFARITPPDVFQEIITHKVLDQINLLAEKPIEVAYFHNLKDALTWTSVTTEPDEQGKLELN